MKTDDLIQALSADLPTAGPASTGKRPGLLGAATLALVMTIPLCLAVYGLQTQGIAEDAVSLSFWAAVLLAGLWSAQRLAQPEPAPALVRLGPMAGLVAALAMMAALGLGTGSTVFRMEHVMFCAEVIGLLSLAPFVALSLAMRRGAPASPRAAGAAIGLAAGAIAAMAYTLSCPIDETLAALSAHGLSVLLISGLGALLGPNIFAW